MKKIALLAALLLSSSAIFADTPNLTVVGDFEVDFDGTVYINGLNVDVLNSQFNHASPQVAIVAVGYNRNLGDVDIDATAIGNTATVDVKPLRSLANIQGNQEGGQVASVNFTRNNLPDAELEIDATAVGNNLTVETRGRLSVETVQFNYDSPISATINVDHNRFSGGWDPDLNATAIGSNASIITMGKIDVSNLQMNINSPMMASVNFSHNIGNIGPLNINAQTIGNSLNIGNPLNGNGGGQ